MNLTRRQFIKLITISTTSLTAFFHPIYSYATTWQSRAFNAKTLTRSYMALFSTTEFITTSKILLRLPEPLNNSSKLPLTVKVKKLNVESIYIFVRDNPQPLAAIFTIPTKTLPHISTQIKVNKSTELIVIVKSANKLYKASRTINVAGLNCG